MQSFQLKEADRLIASPFLPLRFPLPMKVVQLKGTFWALWALALVGFCWCGEKSVVVVGVGKCADCAEKNVKSSDAFSGLGVSIDCKVANGQSKTRGVGKLDKDGKFHVTLPKELVNKDGELVEECFAQLHSAFHEPCPAHNGLEPSKIVPESKDHEGKHTLVTTGDLAFTPSTCASAAFWPYFNIPPLPKFPHFPPKFSFPRCGACNMYPFPPKVYPPIYNWPFPPSTPFFNFNPPPEIFPPPQVSNPKPDPPPQVFTPPVPVIDPKPSPKTCPEPNPEPPPLVFPPPIEPKPEPPPPVFPPPVPVIVPNPNPNPKACPEPNPGPKPKSPPLAFPPPIYPKPEPPPRVFPRPVPVINPKRKPKPRSPPIPKKQCPPVFKKPRPPTPKPAPSL